MMRYALGRASDARREENGVCLMSRETKDAVESAQSQTLLFLQAQLRDLREKIETHISYVLVGENIVFKLKKAVAFSYLDFSTPKQRLAMCLREFSLNQK